MASWLVLKIFDIGISFWSAQSILAIRLAELVFLKDLPSAVSVLFGSSGRLFSSRWASAMVAKYSCANLFPNKDASGVRFIPVYTREPEFNLSVSVIPYGVGQPLSIAVISVVVEPISIDKPKLLGCCFAIKLANPIQLEEAQIVGFLRALAREMKFWFVVQTKGVNCIFGMEFKMYFTPSIFDSKQSHNSPVMVTARMLIFFEDRMSLSMAGKDDFFFQSGNTVLNE